MLKKSQKKTNELVLYDTTQSREMIIDNIIISSSSKQVVSNNFKKRCYQRHPLGSGSGSEVKEAVV